MVEKLKDLLSLEKILKDLKSKDKKIVTTNGCFDLLHSAHLFLLKKAKEKGDILIVLINDDNSIKRYKGEKRPIIPEKQRAAMLSAMECVDYVLIYEEDTPLKVLECIKPDIHVKGKSYDLDKIKDEENLVSSWGGKLITINEPEQEGISTTKIIEDILKVHDNL